MEQPASPRWRQPLSEAEWLAGNQRFTDQLRHSLQHPAVTASVDSLAALFDMDVIDAVASLPLDLEDHPDLAIRIRGALGQQLAVLPPPVDWRYDPHCRSKAFDILYQPLGMLDRRTAIPKPMTIHAEARGRKLHVRIVLIGAGGYWWPDVASALQAALDEGISLTNLSRHRVCAPVSTLHHTRVAGVDISTRPQNISLARIQLLSPLRLRAGAATLFNPKSVLIALANRVAALAHWQQVNLNLDWDALHSAANNIALVDDKLTATSWARGSVRAAARIPVAGCIGSFALSGNLAPFATMLQIAEWTNVGSHAALGFGRIQVSLYP